ncbi:endonuclease/exonuclease/phosphatase family protein [Microdochium trichocladiopsis]|uniref:Endonuclease/exonuclease/phosphatase family protein n=1 Tax=Microdochium trichocladiopsis TaxID=1682393 RepID=A0A9P8XXS4_9PEZI|nr:endonuclease/exonuclease/phosphatase family protein [Microdochium trichocladiopsis]KAH7018447.1 endonuclease/exonuclease/phosphatase family protein [Microdochium trichocladiopsis]
MKSFCAATAAVLLSAGSALAQSIAEINGDRFLGTYTGQVVNITGLITATSSAGFYLRSQQPDKDARTSESIYVFGSNLAGGPFAAGDVVSLSGTVAEYKSSKDYLALAEITKPRDIKIASRGNPVQALQIGKDVPPPPTQAFNALDQGGILGVPNNVSLVSTSNLELQPTKFGMDYWESLLGELVTIKNPRTIAKPNQYGDTWVVGEWPVTGLNKRTGLTMTDGDSNPEAVLIGSPLDGTKNSPDGKLGNKLDDITGVVSQAFGFYRILPTTALKVVEEPSPVLPAPEKFLLKGSCFGMTIGSYNIENFWPGSDNIQGRAEHIARYLDAPDLVFLQEVQDGSGPTSDGTVSGQASLDALIAAIAEITGWSYKSVEIAPEDGKDGGQPGGNIRVAYLYNPKVIELKNYAGPGSATDAGKVIRSGLLGLPKLNFNPVRIDPANAAWNASRKPLVAHWRFVSPLCALGEIFTVNVHWASKGGSSSIHGDARPPVNGGVDQRAAQAEVTGSFIAQILKANPLASIVAAGDFNEFAFAEPLQKFTQISGLKDLDEAAKIPATERYTYLFDNNCQQLDHMYVSPKLALAAPAFKHVHVNSWLSYDDAVSDHDPSVARLSLL